MDPNIISNLADLLRKNGDKVLNSEFKLKLSGQLLRSLNDAFTLIADQGELTAIQGFQVVKPNNSKSNVFRDLQLIYDFVQKTILLCITSFPGDEPFEGPIDITKFRSLERLEIQKFNVNQIMGIQPLRSNLKEIICVRSLNRIEDIITHCGKDNSNGFVWNELKIADFSYNNLIKADTSLEFAQNLVNLNLSHNRLTSVEAVKWLPNLKILDLSFNRLTHIPNFHNESTRHLHILILSNNFVEDLCGISRLDVLNELNLAENCLLSHSYLLPLSTLAALRYLNLYGNPLYCHPKHRPATCNYLHKNVVTTTFILDSDPLSQAEKSLTGFYQSYNTVLTTRLTIKRSSGTSTPTSARHSQSNTPASSFESVHSFLKFKNNQSALDGKDKIKKIQKTRTVEIEDKSNTNLTTVPTKSALKSEKTSETLTNQDHLKTKQQIEDLRKKFGPDWLQSANVQSVEILQGPQQEEEISKLTSQELIDSILDSMNISREISVDKQSASTSTPINDNSQFNFKESPIQKSPTGSAVAETSTKSFNTEYTSFPTEGEIGNSIYKSIVDSNLDQLYNTSSSLQQDDQVASDPEDNEETYIVCEKDSTEQLFVTVSDLSFKEKDALTRRTITKWSLKIIESCDRIKSNTLRINFDTVKKSKKERIYTVEEDLCQELESCLRNILSKRKLSEMNQIIYRCVECSCQFSQEVTSDYERKNQVVACPECKSQFVAEIVDDKGSSVKDRIESTLKSSSKNFSKIIEKTISKQDEDTKTNISNETKKLQLQPEQGHHISGENTLIEGSTSHSSIDVHKGKGNRSVASKKVLSSANSLNESSSCSKLNSQSSLDSTQSVAGSLPNERENDFNNSNTTIPAKNRMLNKDGRDSDVEILSNPSESSIEVLDGNIQNSRKTSSEERRISIAPSLETIEDNVSQKVNFHIGLGYKNETKINLKASTKDFLTQEKKDLASNSKVDKKTNQNLTESSSSGSVTDSVCTTYEQNNSNEQLLDSDSKTSFSNVLGGLLQSTNILLSRNQKTTQCEKFKFNYTDFSDIDHRLKLYFYQSKFESNEHFKWLVKTKLFNETSRNTCESLVIMSTQKLYLMEICGSESDDISKWVKQTHCIPVNRIEKIELLPFKVGLSIKIKAIGGFLLILQDILRTDSLLLFFANNPLPSDCELNYQKSNTVMKKLSQIAGGEQLHMFSIINSCEISCENSIKNYETSAFFTTDNSLYLATSNLSWLAAIDDSDETLDLVDLSLMQMISNLVEVDRISDTVFSINFLDETEDKSEFWKITFETKENAESSLNAISQSWEKLFGVPLLENEFK